MLQVINITCWGLKEAIGAPLDSCQISWKLTTDEEAVWQTACQVKISDHNNKTVYDSGKVITSESRHFMVENLMLKESSDYLIWVRVWDQHAVASEWSSPYRMVTGISTETDRLPFIYADDSGIDPQIHTVWFRRDFSLSCLSRLAVVHIGSIGYHELYINGKKVGNRLLSPVRSQLTQEQQRVNLVSYEVTELLKEGHNTIGVWTDAGWARCEKISPAFACLLSIKGDTEERRLLSDNEWRCMKAPISHIGGFGWSDFGGELVTGGWDNRDWCTPGTEKIVARPVRQLKVTPQIELELTDGDGVLSELMPLSVVNDQGTAFIDMGSNYTGWLEVRLHGGKSGDRVTIQAADKPGEKVSFHQTSEYVMTGSAGRFCNKFNYFSGRYFTISGLREPLKAEDITGVRVGSLLEQKSEFHSSDTLLNQIYQADIDTFSAATLNGITVDCPHRERLGYGETGISTVWGIGVHAFETEAFYRNYFRNWRQSQEPSGYLPHVTPNSSGGGGTAWSSCLTISLYDMYCYTADLSLLEENFDAVQKWADFLLCHTQEGILQRYQEDSNDWGFLGDWATPEGDDWGDSENAAFFNNCVAAYTLLLTTEMADILNRVENRRKYQTGYCMMRQAIHQKYGHGREHWYAHGEQRYLAAALCAGIVPESEKESVIKAFAASLQDKGYLDSGSAGTVFVLRAALRYGLQDEIYEILGKRDCPGYGYFITQGQNTWPEMWDMRDVYGGSRIHTCYTGISGWIHRVLSGITPQKYGMREIAVSPYFPDSLDSLQIEVDYGYGKIKTYWQRDGKRILYHLELPPNTIAQLILPEVETRLLSGKHAFVLEDKKDS